MPVTGRTVVFAGGMLVALFAATHNYPFFIGFGIAVAALAATEGK